MPTNTPTRLCYLRMPAKAPRFLKTVTGTRFSRPSAKPALSSVVPGAKDAFMNAGKYVGDSSMAQVSVGFQAGGKAFSQIIFFQDKMFAGRIPDR